MAKRVSQLVWTIRVDSCCRQTCIINYSNETDCHDERTAPRIICWGEWFHLNDVLIIIKHDITDELFQRLFMISILFEKPNDINSHKVKFLSATEILIFLKTNSSLNRLSPVSVGKALKLLKYERVKSKGIYGYYVAHTGRQLVDYKQ